MKSRVSLLAIAAFPVLVGAGEANLDWITGSWCSEAGDARIREVWLPPHGNALFGVNETSVDGQTVASEFLRIDRDEDQTLRYHAQPNGASVTVFNLTESGDNWLRFENPEHDFPQVIEYRKSEGGLIAQIAGPGEDGNETVIPFEFAACDSGQD